MGSRLCTFVTGSFAYYHFQLYDIYLGFLFAFRAIKRKFYKDCILIHFCFCLCSAERARYPQRLVFAIVQNYTSEYSTLLCVQRPALAIFSLLYAAIISYNREKTGGEIGRTSGEMKRRQVFHSPSVLESCSKRYPTPQTFFMYSTFAAVSFFRNVFM